MKGLSTTLIIVISAVVILVAALVVLTIFGQGASVVASLAQARSVCNSQAAQSYETVGVMPINWDVPSVNVNGELKSCADAYKEIKQACTCVDKVSGDSSKGKTIKCEASK